MCVVDGGKSLCAVTALREVKILASHTQQKEFHKDTVILLSSLRARVLKYTVLHS